MATTEQVIHVGKVEQVEQVRAKKAKVVERPSETIPSRIQWVNIKASQNKETATFYEKVLGWKAISDRPEADSWLEIKGPNSNETNLSIQNKATLHADVPVGHVGLTLVVKDLAKFHEYVKDTEGLKVVRVPTKEQWGGFVASYSSPDSTEITVLEDWVFETAPKGTSGCTFEMKAEVAKSESVSSAVVEQKEAIKPKNGEGVCFLEIPCADMKRVSKFFTDTFGWTFTERNGMTFYESNGCEFSMRGKLSEREERLQGGMLHINVKDMTAAHEKVKANNGTVLSEWSELPPMATVKHYTSMIKDTEGNEWSLYFFEANNKRKADA